MPFQPATTQGIPAKAVAFGGVKPEQHARDSYRNSCDRSNALGGLWSLTS